MSKFRLSPSGALVAANIVFCLLVVSVSAHSMAFTGPAINSDCLQKIEMLDVTEETTPLRLFEFNSVPGALQISGRGGNPNGSQLENKIVPTSYSKRGLQITLNTTEGTMMVINLLVRLGIISPEAADPFYAPLVLAAKNEEVDLRATYPDKAVDEYLKVKKLLKMAELQKLPPILPASTRHRRGAFLYWQILKALDKIPDETEDGLSAIRAAFTEIARIDEILPSPQQSAEGLAKTQEILDGLKAQAKYVPRELKLRETLHASLSEIPFVGLGISWSQEIINGLFQRNRLARTRVMDPGAAPKRSGKILKYIMGEDLFDQVPGSYNVGLTNRDPFNFGAKADGFLHDYLASKTPAPLFSAQFADALEAAYPELKSIRKQPGVDMNNVGARGGFVVDGPFGPGTFEGYKVMTRAALTLALVRGESQYFSGLSVEDFNDLRTDFLSDTQIVKDGQTSPAALDEFMVNLMIDTLGRGSTPFLNAMNKEYKIRETVGTDYERRSLALLEEYRLTSHSFARLDNQAQKRIIRNFKYIDYFNFGQSIQFEGGRSSFDQYSKMNGEQSPEDKEREIFTLIDRSLLSFASLPGSLGVDSPEMTAGSSTLTSQVYKKWTAFKTVIHGLLREKISPEDSYDQYLAWAAKAYGLPFEPNNDSQATIVRLAGQARSVTAEQARQIAVEFAELNAVDKEILIKAETKFPILNYGSADLISLLANGQTQKPYLAAFQVLASIYRKLQSNSDFQLAYKNYPKRQLKVNLRYVVQFAMQNNSEQLLSDKALLFVMRLNDGSFQINVNQQR